jgi:hypothetical protein
MIADRIALSLKPCPMRAEAHAAEPPGSAFEVVVLSGEARREPSIQSAAQGGRQVDFGHVAAVAASRNLLDQRPHPFELVVSGLRRSVLQRPSAARATI